jgi:hypothetical protein
MRFPKFTIRRLNVVKPVGVALTSDAAQVAGLGRIYFGLHHATDSRGSQRIGKNTTSRRPAASVIALLIIRFLFSYTHTAWMQPKKIGLFRVFRRRRWASTSSRRLVSLSRFEANFIFR